MMLLELFERSDPNSFTPQPNILHEIDQHFCSCLHFIDFKGSYHHQSLTRRTRKILKNSIKTKDLQFMGFLEISIHIRKISHKLRNLHFEHFMFLELLGENEFESNENASTKAT